VEALTAYWRDDPALRAKADRFACGVRQLYTCSACTYRLPQ
jgi:hypothetical protein